MLRYILGIYISVLLVKGQTVLQGNISEWCPSSMNPFFSFTEQTGSSAQDFTFHSTIYTEEGESAPLYIKVSSATTPFIFKTFSNDGTPQAQRKCIGSQSLTLYNYLNDYLFFNSLSNYYVCRYMKDSDSALIPFNTTIPGFVISYFTPYVVNNNSIYVRVRSTTSSKVIRYIWDSRATLSMPLQIFDQSPEYQSQLSPSGTPMFLYKPSTVSFVRISSNTWAGTSWENDTVLTSAVVRGNFIALVQLREQRTVIALRNTTSDSGSIYMVVNNTARFVFSYTTLGKLIDDFTDNLNNFIRVRVEDFYWLTLRTAEYQFGLLSSYFSIADLNYTSRVLKTSNIVKISLSQNKATILYSNGWMDILSHEGSNNVKWLFSKQVTGLPALNVSQKKQYVVKLNCTCAVTVKKHVCFSQTLNCVIINKVTSSNCLQKIFKTSW